MTCKQACHLVPMPDMQLLQLFSHTAEGGLACDVDCCLLGCLTCLCCMKLQLLSIFHRIQRLAQKQSWQHQDDCNLDAGGVWMPPEPCSWHPGVSLHKAHLKAQGCYQLQQSGTARTSE